MFAVAEEEEGVFGVVVGGEAAVGSDVEDAVVGDVVSEGGFGELVVEEFESGVEGVEGWGGLDDAIEFGFDAREGAEGGDRIR